VSPGSPAPTGSPASAGAVPQARGKRGSEMQPGMMTDHEINVELTTASGDRLAALQAEREERRIYRASMRLSGHAAGTAR
jgi:hypothetical protein